MTQTQMIRTQGQEEEIEREEIRIGGETLNTQRPNELKKEIKRLYRIAEKIGGERLPALLIIGPPGVGKSTAVKEAAGFTKFSKKTLVIAAGNPPSEYGIARVLPEAVVNRTMVVYAEPPKIEEWIRWMANQISTLPEDAKEELMRTLTITSTFLTIYPTLLHNQNIQRDPNIMENMPTPRSWSFFIFTTPYSKLEELAKKGASAVAQYLSSFVGREAASRFATLFKVKIDPLEKLLQNPSTVDSYNLEQMLALAVAIADNIAYRATAAKTPEEKIETTYQALKQLEPLLTKITIELGRRAIILSRLIPLIFAEKDQHGVTISQFVVSEETARVILEWVRRNREAIKNIVYKILSAPADEENIAETYSELLLEKYQPPLMRILLLHAIVKLPGIKKT